MNLYQADLLKVGPISGHGTLKLLPLSSKKKKQKFIIGDDTESISCYKIKKGEPINAYKSNSLGGAITNIQLGSGKSGSEKIFVSCGQKINGFNKKGKEFFEFKSNSSENINRVYVNETNLFMSTDYGYNLYENGKDKYFYICQDKINDMIIENIFSTNEYNPILACQDKYIRVIKESEAYMKKSLGSAATSLTRFLSSENENDKNTPSTPQIIYGTSNGTIGNIKIHSTKLKIGWKIQSEDNNASPINCINTFDINKDGNLEILVGRDNGKFEIFTSNKDGEFIKDYDFDLNESIRSVEAGVVTTAGFNEVITSTYSGRIVSFTNEPLDQPDTEDVYGRSRGTVQRESRIVKLRKEVALLEEKIAKEKEKAKQIGNCLPIAEEINVNIKFILVPDEAAYHLSIEIPAPIDTICLQASIPIDLLDIENNKAILSISPMDKTSNSYLLATYRCIDSINNNNTNNINNTNRLDIRMRTLEGQYGDLEITILPDVKPKIAQIVKCYIKPLSLHYRINDTNQITKPTSLNSLQLTGNFKMVQIHEIISICLPEIPTRLQEDTMSFVFKNSFHGSILYCTYRKGEAIFESNSISTIAILKEIITQEATIRKITLNINFDIDRDTISDFLSLLRPKLDEQYGLVSQVQLIDAIKEIQMQENDYENWLAPEYKNILENSEKLKNEYKTRHRALEYLTGIITDLYVDINKFKGINVKSNIPKLNQLIQNYNYDQLLGFLLTSGK